MEFGLFVYLEVNWGVDERRMLGREGALSVLAHWAGFLPLYVLVVYFWGKRIISSISLFFSLALLHNLGFNTLGTDIFRGKHEAGIILHLALQDYLSLSCRKFLSCDVHSWSVGKFFVTQ